MQIILSQELPGDVNKIGPDDFLSRALDRPEHSGRVRAVGAGVTPTSYFGHQQRAKKSEISVLKGEIEDMRKKMLEMQRKNEQLFEHLQQNNQMPTFMQQCSDQTCESLNMKDSYGSAPKVPIPMVNDRFFFLLNFIFTTIILIDSLSILNFLVG